MKKNVVIISLILLLVIIMCIVVINLNSKVSNVVKKQNAEYEKYIEDTIYGTDVVTLINKAISSNEANNVENTIEGIEIYTQNGTLHLEGLTADYQIYNMSGQMVYSGNASTLDLTKGIYIIRIADKSQKIVL